MVYPAFGIVYGKFLALYLICAAQLTGLIICSKGYQRL